MYKHLIIGLVAFFLMVATTYLPTRIENPADIRSVKFGYPLGFVTQDYSDRNTQLPVDVYFSTIRLQTNSKSTKILPNQILINYLLFLGIIEGIWYGIEKTYAKK